MEVRSPMVGKIIEIVVEPGATVAADDDLLVIESMKMEIPVGAPQAGAVAAVHVAVGDTVGEGALLVTLAG
jgi:acetyl-CoA carboxylase biotin carboxyl carrier protein